MAPTIFVSSPHREFSKARDLVEFLAKAVRLRGCGEALVLRTETGGASTSPPLETCLERVRAADLFFLLLGHRFGASIEGDELGRSYTEAEFDAAIECGVPIMAFVSTNPGLFRRSDVDSNDTEVARFRQKVEEAQARDGFMLQQFSSWDQFNTTLENALEASLPKVVAAKPIALVPTVENLLLPRVNYPPFDGMDDETLHGRSDELKRLDNWFEDEESSGLMIRAIGGMGKTSLAWCWLDTLPEDPTSSHASGIFWFSFYASDHSIRRFAFKLREWLEPFVAPERRRSIREKDSDWTAIKHYLENLKHKPLIILDGLEAEFVGYIGRKPAGAGKLSGEFGDVSSDGGSEESADKLHDFAQFRDEAGGTSLAEFIQSNLAKILITTREVPTAFVRMSRGKERLIGKLDEIILEELSPDNARVFLEDYGVNGQEKTLKTLVASPVIRHPLVLKVFANRILNDDIALGDLDKYIELNPGQKLLELAIQRRTNILHFVFNDLTDIERFILDLITASDIAMPRDFVEALAQQKGYGQSVISAAFDQLRRKRGLINAARHKIEDSEDLETVYSMHPVCREYWREVDLKSLQESAEFMDEHFEARLFGAVGRGVKSPTVFDLESRVLVITRVALEARRFDRAWKLSNPFRNCYEKFGLYSYQLEHIASFILFDNQDGKLIANALLSEPAEAAHVLLAGANIFRLYGHHKRAIACAQALVDLINRRKEAEKEAKEADNAKTQLAGKSETQLPSLMIAKWGLVLASLENLNYREIQKVLKDFWDWIAKIDAPSDENKLVGEFLTECKKYFQLEQDHEISQFREFILLRFAIDFSFTTLSWNIQTRLDDMIARGWTEDSIIDSVYCTFQDTEPRALRITLLTLVDRFAERGRLDLANRVQSELDGMEGWALLDLDMSLQNSRINVMLASSEAADFVSQGTIEDIRSSIDTYELHYKDRFTRINKCWLAVVRARFAVLSSAKDASSQLDAAASECMDMALPLHKPMAKHIVRCAESLGRQDLIDTIKAELPERYDTPWSLPDPFFGFTPDARLTGPRPWEADVQNNQASSDN